MLAWMLTACYVLGVLAAVDSILNTRTATGAIAWAVSLVTVPFIALPAYLVFGRSKFAGLEDAFAQNRQEIHILARQIRENLRPWNAGGDEQSGTYRAIRRLSGMDLLRGNRLELLNNGEATFDSIFSGIAQARRYVLVQFYMIHDDGLGRRLKGALLERARASVRICVVYDEVGSAGLPKSYLNELKAAGVEVSSFKPTQGWRNRFQLNFRNHRKIVVVDGAIAWVGGHNVGDEYLGLDPEFTPWRDTHVRIEGPAALQLQQVMLGDWYWATRRIPEANWAPDAAPGSDARVMIIPSAPSQQLETAALLFVTALHAAKHRIWLTAPYFIPDQAVLKALKLAALRGVDVRLITTGKPDSLPVYFAAFHFMKQLSGLGIRFYAYKPGFLHAKAMLIDDEVATVGTANFDNRSFRLNFEVTALIVDQAFASQVKATFEQDFAHAEIIDPDDLDRKPFWWRFAVGVSRLAAPVL